MECDDAPIQVTEEYPPYKKPAALSKSESAENNGTDGAEIEAEGGDSKKESQKLQPKNKPKNVKK